jgi:hypothetical protein
VYGSTASSAC